MNIKKGFEEFVLAEKYRLDHVFMLARPGYLTVLYPENPYLLRCTGKDQRQSHCYGFEQCVKQVGPSSSGKAKELLTNES